MSNNYKDYIVLIDGVVSDTFDTFLGAFNYAVQNNYGKEWVIVQQVDFEVRKK